MFKRLIEKSIADGGITFRFNESRNFDDVEEAGGDYWYYPVLPDSTLIVDEHILYEQTKLFISASAGGVFRPDWYVGIWRNPDDDMYYIDINERSAEKAEAIKRVKAINSCSSSQIIAIYNPDLDESVTV